MKKKWLIVIVIILGILSAAGYTQYQQYKQNQIEESEREWEFKNILYAMGYWDLVWNDSELSYEERYYEKMLKDEELPDRVTYFNLYMQEEYPNITFKEIIFDELKNTPYEVHTRLEELYEHEVDMLAASSGLRIRIFEDREYIMTILGYESLLEGYAECSHSNEYYKEEFIEDSNLPARLEKLNQNIKTELSGEYEEITIERLLNDQLQVVEELREIEQKCPDILG